LAGREGAEKKKTTPVADTKVWGKDFVIVVCPVVGGWSHLKEPTKGQVK